MLSVGTTTAAARKHKVSTEVTAEGTTTTTADDPKSNNGNAKGAGAKNNVNDGATLFDHPNAFSNPDAGIQPQAKWNRPAELLNGPEYKPFSYMDTRGTHMDGKYLHKEFRDKAKGQYAISACEASLEKLFLPGWGVRSNYLEAFLHQLKSEAHPMFKVDAMYVDLEKRVLDGMRIRFIGILELPRYNGEQSEFAVKFDDCNYDNMEQVREYAQEWAVTIGLPENYRQVIKQMAGDPIGAGGGKSGADAPVDGEDGGNGLGGVEVGDLKAGGEKGKSLSSKRSVGGYKGADGMAHRPYGGTKKIVSQTWTDRVKPAVTALLAFLIIFLIFIAFAAQVFIDARRLKKAEAAVSEEDAPAEADDAA